MKGWTIMHKGDGEKQQDLSSVSSTSLYSFIFHIVLLFPSGKQMNTRQVVRAAAGRKEKADLWEDYGICFRTKREGNMADVFCKIDYLAVWSQNSKEKNRVADRNERITVEMLRFLGSNSPWAPGMIYSSTELYSCHLREVGDGWSHLMDCTFKISIILLAGNLSLLKVYYWKQSNQIYHNMLG